MILGLTGSVGNGGAALGVTAFAKSTLIAADLRGLILSPPNYQKAYAMFREGVRDVFDG